MAEEIPFTYSKDTTTWPVQSASCEDSVMIYGKFILPRPTVKGQDTTATPVGKSFGFDARPGGNTGVWLDSDMGESVLAVQFYNRWSGIRSAKCILGGNQVDGTPGKEFVHASVNRVLAGPISSSLSQVTFNLFTSHARGEPGPVSRIISVPGALEGGAIVINTETSLHEWTGGQRVYEIEIQTPTTFDWVEGVPKVADPITGVTPGITWGSPVTGQAIPGGGGAYSIVGADNTFNIAFQPYTWVAGATYQFIITPTNRVGFDQLRNADRELFLAFEMVNTSLQEQEHPSVPNLADGA
tara:strand:+ start:4710 stop:5603 length:894 start_codon:yes stop_codon:yes gene_type:complete